MLIRRCVGKLQADYYAQPSNRVVGSIPAIPFSSIWSDWQWRRMHANFYKNRPEHEGRWLTPVELMKPYYSNTLANYIAHVVEQSHTTNDPIDVVEIGGGKGTNANLILSHLSQQHPQIYERVNFTLMDSSPPLLEFQREMTRQMGNHVDKIHFELKDMLDVAEGNVPFLSPSDRPTVLVGCEILDNLPHDKIHVKPGRLLEEGQVQRMDSKEASEHDITSLLLEGDTDTKQNLQEVFVKLSDPLITHVLKTVPAYKQLSSYAWIPTVACGILNRLGQERPNCSVLLADFDWLPNPELLPSDAKRTSVWGAGEPIVTCMEGKDHECYLQAPSHCDILFATDYENLAAYVQNNWGNESNTEVMVHKQGDFLELYGPEQVNATKHWLTGYTPLLYDYSNCSILAATRTQSSQ